uniref:Domain X domain-containing protein n=1 Tax=Glaukea argentea TaxID=2894057 RepID=A0A386B1H9_9CHLO|nr:hypothetical protein [Udotea argentea]AYC65552.1 hypothetical protein [Udotea argentea]
MKFKFLFNKNSILNNQEKFWLIKYIQPIIKNSIPFNYSKKYLLNRIFYQLINPQMLFFGFLIIFKNSKKLNFYSKVFVQSVENYSLSQLINLHYSLKNQTYKPLNKKLYLKVDDFIVQECLQLILNKIYNFKNSPQDTLQKIKIFSLNGNFALEVQLNLFDLKIPLLLDILKQNIRDKKFLNLLSKFTNQTTLSRTYILTLLNIYLFKLDFYIEKEIKKLPLIFQQLQKKIFYIRYINELVIIIDGTYTIMVLIKNKIKTWLITELLVKPKKIFIKKLKKQSLHFLGFTLKYFKEHKLIITIDQDKLITELKNHAFLHKSKSLHKNIWVNFSDFQIILIYSKLIRRIFNYYFFHINTRKQLYWIYYIIKQSCIKTLCMKHKQRTVKQIFKKYDKNLTIHGFGNRKISFPLLNELIITPIERYK